MTTPDDVLAGVGPRLRQVRKEREVTLAALSEATGISVSTLSRLESGLRRPSLELLLPIARAHQVPLDELVGAPPVGDPRVRARPVVRHGRTHWPLTRQAGGLQAFKVLEPQSREEPDPRTHEGTSGCTSSRGGCGSCSASTTWCCRRGGRGVRHAGAALVRVDGEGPAEFLSLFGPQGERMHVRARPAQA